MFSIRLLYPSKKHISDYSKLKRFTLQKIFSALIERMMYGQYLHMYQQQILSIHFYHLAEICSL